MRRAPHMLPAALGALIAVLGVTAPRASARIETDISPPE